MKTPDKNPAAQELGKLGGKARWRKIQSKKERSEIMKEVRRKGLNKLGTTKG